MQFRVKNSSALFNWNTHNFFLHFFFFDEYFSHNIVVLNPKMIDHGTKYICLTYNLKLTKVILLVIRHGFDFSSVIHQETQAFLKEVILEKAINQEHVKANFLEYT